MQTIRTKSHVGSDGILKLELPIGINHQDLEIVIVINPLESSKNNDLGWEANFFEQTFGCLKDEPLEIPSQLPFEERKEFL